jgi:ABC-type nitrate/sulfonate/bicarbonate transport system substrate-binding protein
MVFRKVTHGGLQEETTEEEMFPSHSLKPFCLSVALLLIWASTSPAQDKALKKFHWGVTSLSASQWIPWIAKEAKLYEKYGMEAELVLLRGSGQSAQAIIGGSILGAPCTLTTVMGANLSGADLVTVAHTVSGVQSKLVVRPDIKKPDDPARKENRSLGIWLAGRFSRALHH